MTTQYGAEPETQPPVPAAVRAALTRVYAVQAIPAVLEQFGVPAGPVLQTVGLSRQDFDDPERVAPFSDLDRLIGECVRTTRCTHFGLLVGQCLRLQSLGIAGHLTRHAPSVGDALRDLTAYFVLQDDGALPTVAIHDGRATLSYGIHAVGIVNSDQIYDLAVAGMLNVLRELCGPAWEPEFVRLPHRRPADLRPYREILGARVRFDSVQAAVAFPSAWLEHPVAGADPTLRTVLAERAARDLARQAPQFHHDVCRVIRGRLVAGDCCRASVARDLGLHPRSLGRRLQASGTSFQSMLDGIRAQLATQLLEDTRLPVGRIAASVGYRDPTVFARAFRRWTGRTPRRYRADLARHARVHPAEGPMSRKIGFP